VSEQVYSSTDNSRLAPPSSNTGAENTNGIEALIDWVAFTLPTNEVKSVFSVLGIPPDEFVQMPRGANGYLNHVRCGDIAILSNGTANMGCHVFLSGQGCRQYEARFGNVWPLLFSKIFDMYGHFTRIDTAIDDYAGIISVPILRNKVLSREVLTRFKRARDYTEYDLSAAPGTNEGETLYFGRPSSRIKIRFYDKAKEQKVDYTWTRAEVECHNERANVMAYQIITSDLGETIAGVLKNYINFVDPSDDPNKARWSTTEWWADFIGSVAKVKLTIKKAARSIKDVEEWMERQVSPTLALLLIHHKNNDQFIDRLIKSGKKRLKPRHLLLLNQAAL
jgi:phage replication initiation protein